MPDLKDFKPVDFKIIPEKRGCHGCVFLTTTDGVLICKTTRDLDLMDLQVEIDKHFGQNCYHSSIIYKLKSQTK